MINIKENEKLYNVYAGEMLKFAYLKARTPGKKTN